MRVSMLKGCHHSCWGLLERECNRGSCVLPPFHDGQHMCACCRDHMIHRKSQNIARRDGFQLMDERHDGFACNNIWHNRFPHVYDKAESPCSESTTPSSIPNEVLCKDDGILLEEYGTRTPSHIARSDKSYKTQRKKRRVSTIMRTTDGSLRRQNW